MLNSSQLSPRQMWRIAVDPAYVMQCAGTPPDPWQTELLRKAPTPGMRGLVVSSRQAGKSTSFSSLAVWWAMVKPAYDCLVLPESLPLPSDKRPRSFTNAVTLWIGSG